MIFTKKTVVSLISIAVLFYLSVMTVNAANQNNNEGPITFYNIYIDESNNQGPWYGTYDYPYQNIQEGIDNADEGDTLYVNSYLLPYSENIVIDKSITLIGENYENTIIDGGGNGDVIEITASSVIIEGFTIRNSGKTGFDHGIKTVQNSPPLSDINIIDCEITDNAGGIRFNEITDSNIENCYIHDNKCSPITVYHESENIAIKDCIIANNGDGTWSGSISIDGIAYNGVICSNIEISGCEIYGSTSSGITTSNVENVNIFDNHIYNNDNSGVFINGVDMPAEGVSIHNNIIENNNEEQITLQDCKNAVVTIKENTIKSNNKDGIFLLRSSYNIINCNFIEGNNKGIHFLGSMHNLNFVFCNNNIVKNNELHDNYYGIYLNAINLNNKFYLNNFENNVKNAYDLGTDIWYNENYGNYWDDYAGQDSDGDGIGDTPYNIKPYLIRNKDYYPMVEEAEPEDPEGEDLLLVGETIQTPYQSTSVFLSISQSIGNIFTESASISSIDPKSESIKQSSSNIEEEEVIEEVKQTSIETTEISEIQKDESVVQSEDSEQTSESSETSDGEHSTSSQDSTASSSSESSGSQETSSSPSPAPSSSSSAISSETPSSPSISSETSISK